MLQVCYLQGYRPTRWATYKDKQEETEVQAPIAGVGEASRWYTLSSCTHHARERQPLPTDHARHQAMGAGGQDVLCNSMSKGHSCLLLLAQFTAAGSLPVYLSCHRMGHDSPEALRPYPSRPHTTHTPPSQLGMSPHVLPAETLLHSSCSP